MVTPEQIDAMAAIIAEKYRPEKIILFGSYARGEARKYGPIELLVIMPAPEGTLRMAGRIRGSLSSEHAIEVLVREPAKFMEAIETGSGSYREMLDRARVLYTAPGVDPRLTALIAQAIADSASRPRREPISRDQILEFADRVAARYHPEKILLFGSHARREAAWNSDVDLMVILPFEGSPAQQYARILTELRPTFAIDLLVRTPAAVERRLNMGDPFLREIFNTGEVLYDIARA